MIRAYIHARKNFSFLRLRQSEDWSEKKKKLREKEKEPRQCVTLEPFSRGRRNRSFETFALLMLVNIHFAVVAVHNLELYH